MIENFTIAYIEYESSLILVKIGDWVKEKIFSFEHGTNLYTAMIASIDENFEWYFFQTLIREHDKTNQSLLKQIKNCKENTDFHYIIDEASVEMKVIRTRKNILANQADYLQHKQDLSEVLLELNSLSLEAVIFSEINHDNTLYVKKYIQLYLEIIEEFIENNKNPSLAVFTIFINTKDKAHFFDLVQNRQSKYSCFSRITLS